MDRQKERDNTNLHKLTGHLVELELGGSRLSHGKDCERYTDRYHGQTERERDNANLYKLTGHLVALERGHVDHMGKKRKRQRRESETEIQRQLTCRS